MHILGQRSLLFGGLEKKKKGLMYLTTLTLGATCQLSSLLLQETEDMMRDLREGLASNTGLTSLKPISRSKYEPFFFV